MSETSVQPMSETNVPQTTEVPPVSTKHDGVLGRLKGLFGHDKPPAHGEARRAMEDTMIGAGINPNEPGARDAMEAKQSGHGVGRTAAALTLGAGITAGALGVGTQAGAQEVSQPQQTTTEQTDSPSTISVEQGTDQAKPAENSENIADALAKIRESIGANTTEQASPATPKINVDLENAQITVAQPAAEQQSGAVEATDSKVVLAKPESGSYRDMVIGTTDAKVVDANGEKKDLSDTPLMGGSEITATMTLSPDARQKIADYAKEKGVSMEDALQAAGVDQVIYALPDQGEHPTYDPAHTQKLLASGATLTYNAETGEVTANIKLPERLTEEQAKTFLGRDLTDEEKTEAKVRLDCQQDEVITGDGSATPDEIAGEANVTLTGKGILVGGGDQFNCEFPFDVVKPPVEEAPPKPPAEETTPPVEVVAPPTPTPPPAYVPPEVFAPPTPVTELPFTGDHTKTMGEVGGVVTAAGLAAMAAARAGRNPTEDDARDAARDAVERAAGAGPKPDENDGEEPDMPEEHTEEKPLVTLSKIGGEVSDSDAEAPADDAEVVELVAQVEEEIEAVEKQVGKLRGMLGRLKSRLNKSAVGGVGRAWKAANEETAAPHRQIVDSESDKSEETKSDDFTLAA